MIIKIFKLNKSKICENVKNSSSGHKSLNINLNRRISSNLSQKEHLSKSTVSSVSQKKMETFCTRRKLKTLNGGDSLPRKKIFLEVNLAENKPKIVNRKLRLKSDSKERGIQKKHMLNEILQEYEQISKDKNMLNIEFNNMKKHLSYIRSKLDQSMTVLNRNTTLFAMMKALTHSKLVSPKSKLLKSRRSKKSKKLMVKNKGLKVGSNCEVK